MLQYKLNDYKKAMVIIRHPLDSSIALFNHQVKSVHKYADVKMFDLLNFSKLFLEEGLQEWMQFHDRILEDFNGPIHFVQYEKLKTNMIEEMRSITLFLGFELTNEIESCLILDFQGKFKRDRRPQHEIDAIYKNFTKTQLDKFDNIYDEYLQRFQSRIN